MYHLPESVKCIDPLFYATHSYVNIGDIVKFCVKYPSKFEKTPNHVDKTKPLKKDYQFLILFTYIIYG